MRKGKPSPAAERPDEDGHPAPGAQIGLPVVQLEFDDPASVRHEYLRRESCIRATGLLSLILAVVVILTFGLGSLYELQRQPLPGEGEIPPWMFERWVFRMTILIAVALVAAVTSWGIYGLKNWGRWALLVATALPPPALLCCSQLTHLAANQDFRKSNRAADTVTVSAVSAVPFALILLVMWTPRGKMIFSRAYCAAIRETPELRPGCTAMLPAALIVPAVFVSYLLLLMTALTVLAMLGVIRSI
jgi:hypothetical protein